MHVLVTGISGYVGGLVADALLAEGGVQVRGFARDPSHVQLDVPVVRGDLSTGDGLDEALSGIDVAYYLVHSMEGTTDYTAEELASARRFATACRTAGVKRVVYMSVLTPSGPPSGWSSHVKSRVAVEEALADGAEELVVLRASIVIGAGSRSFRFLLSLVERMPVLPLPPWRHHRTSPIDERDLVASLLLARTAPMSSSPAVWDAVGREVVRYDELIERFADVLLLGRPIVPFPFSLDAITAPVAAAIAGEDLGLVSPLIQSLATDLLARPEDHDAIRLVAPRHALDASIERAIRRTPTPSSDS